MFLEIIIWILMILIFLCLVRAFKGPKLWDRLLAMNLITIKGMLLIILYASMQENTGLIDVAIIYALFSFIGTIFLALFIAEHKRRNKK